MATIPEAVLQQIAQHLQDRVSAQTKLGDEAEKANLSVLRGMFQYQTILDKYRKFYVIKLKPGGFWGSRNPSFQVRELFFAKDARVNFSKFQEDLPQTTRVSNLLLWHHLTGKKFADQCFVRKVLKKVTSKTM